MAGARTVVCISSSIENFKEKLLARGGKLWRPWDLFSDAIFFGLYHPGDYVKYLIHRGDRTVIWCGGDIINLQKSWWRPLIVRVKARHICENEVEHVALASCGIFSEIRPLMFDDPSRFEDCFKPSRTPHVFICVHPGREEEYGLPTVLEVAQELRDITLHVYGVEGLGTPNVIYHGRVPEAQFNQEIRDYQSCLRLNTFDGFGEGVAKSILLGQYPITAIKYPLLAYAPDKESLVHHLKELKKKKESNPARIYWASIL